MTESSYTKPMVVGVRQLNSWHDVDTVEHAMLLLGQNTGNMMFTEALLRVIEGSVWGSFSLDEEALEGCDAIILAAANWINSFDDFGWLADRLERTSLPVIVVGIGAQASTEKEVPAVKPGTLRLLSIAHERSRCIAARGVFTCEVLARYGFKNTTAVGCPSMMLAGPRGPQIVTPNEIRRDSVCIHSTRHLHHRAEPFQKYLYGQAFKHGMDIVLQSERADICLTTGSVDKELLGPSDFSAMEDAYGCSDDGKLIDYLRQHGRAFANYRDWIEYMKTKSFCFGTRIHGTVASIVAGTPATLIAHDSRTQEMAEIMGIPFVMTSDVNCEKDIDPNEMYSAEKTDRMIHTYKKYYERCAEVIALNGVSLRESYRVYTDAERKGAVT